MFTYDAPNEAATRRLGQALAQVLPAGTTIALSGTLGAGKTRLVQAIAAGLNVQPEQVTSPTFVLLQHYHGQRTLHHLDVYRLKDEDEFLQLGPEELFDSPGLTCIEWAEKVQDCLPEERVEIAIEVLGDTGRRFQIATRGPQYEAVLPQLARQLDRCD